MHVAHCIFDYPVGQHFVASSDLPVEEGDMSKTRSATPAASAVAAATPVKAANSWLGAVFVLLIGGFMTFLDTSIVNVAIASIMNVFAATTATIQWVSTIYMLTLGVVAPLSGWLGDKVGYKRLTSPPWRSSSSVPFFAPFPGTSTS